jgi:hypothetical protein
VKLVGTPCLLNHKSSLVRCHCFWILICICICTFTISSHVLLGQKIFFPTPDVFYYMCVVYGHAVYMHTGYGVGVSLRISNPGWKNFIYDILCNIDLCSENF